MRGRWTFGLRADLLSGHLQQVPLQWICAEGRVRNARCASAGCLLGRSRRTRPWASGPISLKARARLCGDARGGDGGVRKELAEGVNAQEPLARRCVVLAEPSTHRSGINEGSRDPALARTRRGSRVGLLRGLHYFLSPRTINARIASERVTSFLAAHRSTAFRRSTGIRNVVMGSRPVVGRPLFLRRLTRAAASSATAAVRSRQ